MPTFVLEVLDRFIVWTPLHNPLRPPLAVSKFRYETGTICNTYLKQYGPCSRKLTFAPLTASVGLSTSKK